VHTPSTQLKLTDAASLPRHKGKHKKVALESDGDEQDPFTREAELYNVKEEVTYSKLPPRTIRKQHVQWDAETERIARILKGKR
jgi:hypothetical protein